MDPLSNEEWRLVGGSVVGSSHLKRGTACEDAHAYWALDDGTFAIAVADGAGSAKRAREGSQCAVRAVLDYLASNILSAGEHSHKAWTELLRRALVYAHHEVRAAAGEGDCRELASTLLVAVAAKPWFATLQVGDGGIVYRDRQRELRVLTHEEGGEYLNETTFLTSESFERAAHIHVLPLAELDACAIFTDGVQLLAVQKAGDVAHKPFFDPVFAFAARQDATEQELRSFLSSERVHALTDDDTTLVLAVRHEAS